MDTNVFYTAVTQPGGKTQLPGTQPNGGAGKSGVFTPVNGFNFFDLLFNRITAQRSESSDHKTGNGTPPITHPVFGTNGELLTNELNIEASPDPLTAESILPEGFQIDIGTGTDAEVDPAISPILLPEVTSDSVETTETSETPETSLSNIKNPGQKQFQEFLDTLLQGIPEEQRPLILDVHSHHKQGALQNLVIDPENTDPQSPALVATGLTPATLTDILKQLSEEQGEDGVEQLFVIGIVKIMPKPARPEAIFLPRTVIIQQAPVNNISENTGTDTNTAANLNTPTPTEEPSSLMPQGFQNILDILENAQTGTEGQPKNTFGLKKALHNIIRNHAAGHTVPGQAASGVTNANTEHPGQAGLFFSSEAWKSIFPEGLEWNLPGQESGALTMSTTGPANLTSLVSQAAHASQSHPASQLVAATISKAAGNGENKNITIKLNPPELGRVDIRIEFSKDKTMKVHLVIEKPETHLMLQRDAHLLERSMQDSGIDTEGSSLSFELAQDDSQFESGGGRHDHDGTNNGQNGTDTDDDDMEIIEYTMTWHVDPETGLMRYNLLA